MTPHTGRQGRAIPLTDRRAECGALDRLVETVRAGESRALVVRGEPGVGKTVLLEFLTGRASAAGCRVARAVGVQSEMELAFAGVHQLCAPFLSGAESLPVPQRDALRIAFGMAAGPPPDRFLVGLAVLSLLSEVAGDRPLICVIDDEQWLDRASAQTLGFAARRLGADPVGLVFAARDPSAELAGLPELEVAGLDDSDARALLEAALAGPLDVRVRDLIIAETRGNPLALLELPRGLSPAELAGGFGLPGARSAVAPLTGRIEDSFARQLDALPADTRRLVQLAAADPSGDRSLVWRAGGRLGIAIEAGTAAEEAGLVEFGSRVRFRHPLARSAAYRSASFSARQQVHAALAEVTDPIADPDRRAWHRAQAVAGPDEEVAAELEQSAGRAQARGGLAAAAAFLERATALTADPARQAERALAAAQAHMQAGAFGKALDLLAAAEAGPLDEFASARVDLLRGHVAFASSRGSDAPPLLLKAAKRLESLNRDLARDTYLTAWIAATFAGRLAGAGHMLEVCRAAQALPPPEQGPGPLDLLLEGFARLVTDGSAAAAPALRQAVRAFASMGIPVSDRLQFGPMAQGAAIALWDEDGQRAILVRQVQLARTAGALEQLPIDLVALAIDEAWRGDFAGAVSLIAECDAVCEATGGSRVAPFAGMFLGALRGDQAAVTPLIEATLAAAEAGGQGGALTGAHWAAAVLNNGLGRYAEAQAAAEEATRDTIVYVSILVVPELVEAAARTGNTDVAAGALQRLAETTQPSGNDLALGIEARCRALLSEGETAERLYQEAIDRLSRTRLRPDLARAHLLYGEWLRRQGRRLDAREQLRTAHDTLAALGMTAFGERARRELIATGEKVSRRTVENSDDLTAQERLIARLARDGLSNPEIGAQLFISTRTVEWHLRKVFTKLGVSSRGQLRQVLNDQNRPAASG
jgi:DNA-binding CsgD family transcriptional regulator/tetratricopeptide (TPR) repeat protein